MEDLIDIKRLKENKNLIIQKIFTKRQYDILIRKIQKKELSMTEKTYYYKYIKPKIKAIFSLSGIEDIIISGKESMNKERIETSKKIIAKIKKKHKNQKIMISGSYLYNKKYNDIDVFIFSKYEKEDYRKGKVHVNFFKESMLDNIFFSSLSKISISNFTYEKDKEHAISLKEILHDYEIVINHILNKEDYKNELRTLLLKIEYLNTSKVISSKELHYIIDNIKNKDIKKIISNKLINALVIHYSKKIINNNLKKQIKEYDNLLKKYKSSNNIRLYVDTYNKVIELAA